MRYTPIAAVLSLAVLVSASVSLSTPPEKLDPRAQALVAEGRAAIAAGQADVAADAFEAALTVEPGSVTVLLDLAAANRRMGLQGRALHYYRVALERDPDNVAAIAGEGEALAEKGATEKANRNLAQLRALCGSDCAETRSLASAIAAVPKARVVTADASAAKTVPGPSEN